MQLFGGGKMSMGCVEVPANVCPTSGPALHLAPGNGFTAGRGVDVLHAAGKAAQ